MSNDGFGQTFEIPVQNWKKFEKEIEKLSRKAEKLVGEQIWATPVGQTQKKLSNGQVIQVYEVFVGGPEPKLNGWKFAARLDHGNETGNIVRTVPGEEIPEHFRCANPNCDHCGINRYRRDTFVLRNIETNEYKQVGSTCLADFLGHGDPAKWAKLAELLSYAVERGHAASSYEHLIGQDLRYIDLESYLGFVASYTRRRGYMGRKLAKENGKSATPDLAYHAMVTNYDMVDEDFVSDEDRKLAEEAVEWAQSLESKPDLSDYEHNILVIAASGVVEYRNIGFAASIVGSYVRNRKPAKKVSEYVGQPGDKLSFAARVTNDPFKMDSKFGESWFHQFLDDNGNVLIAYLNQKVASRDERIKISAKVKGHGERNGVKQTTINYVKVQR